MQSGLLIVHWLVAKSRQFIHTRFLKTILHILINKIIQNYDQSRISQTLWLRLSLDWFYTLLAMEEICDFVKQTGLWNMDVVFVLSLCVCMCNIMLYIHPPLSSVVMRISSLCHKSGTHYFRDVSCSVWQCLGIQKWISNRFKSFFQYMPQIPSFASKITF